MKSMLNFKKKFINNTQGVIKEITLADNELVFTLQKDNWLEGVRLGVSGQVEGESITLQLHHPVHGHLTDYDFATNVNIDPNNWLQGNFKSKYWADLEQGLILVAVYNLDPGNTNTVKLYADFYLHKLKEYINGDWT